MTATVNSVLRYVSRRALDRRIMGWERVAIILDGGDKPAWVAWMTISEEEARQWDPPEHIRRIRTPAQPWCAWLGADTSVADDLPLQAFFATVPDDGWPRLAATIRYHQHRTVADWRATGERLLAATRGAPAAPGPYAGAFSRRGTGRRSPMG